MERPACHRVSLRAKERPPVDLKRQRGTEDLTADVERSIPIMMHDRPPVPFAFRLLASSPSPSGAK
jgi:hypothetical protein